MPVWFSLLSWLSLAAGVVSAGLLARDMLRDEMHMAIMRLVWPLCGLFGGPLVVWFYRKHGRDHAHHMEGGHDGGHDHHHSHHHAHHMEAEHGEGHDHMHSGHDHHHHDHGGSPTPASVAKGTLHCGAGCTLGDIIAECLVLAFPGILAIFGYPWAFGEPIFAIWILDYLFAFGIGIVFQYLAIVPMRGLSFSEGVKAALKADAASLTAWQIGMYGVMALAHFWLFGHVFGTSANAADPEFWFAMQIAMMAGFCTAFPVNWWLIRVGIKEGM